MAEETVVVTPDPTNTAWYAGLDDTTKGYVTNRGLGDKSPAEAFAAAAKAHREAEAFIGAPADQLLRLPKEAGDVDGWKAVWQRLGAPAAPEGYDFSALKRAGDQPVEAALTDALRTAAATANLPVAAAQTVATSVIQALDAQAATQAGERTAALETSRAALKANWGQNYEANQFIAKQAAQALGVAPEAVAALEGVVGYDKVMEMFRVVGTKIGEDKFVTTGGNNSGGVMTQEAAQERLNELKTDKEWTKRFLDGGSAENKEFKALTTLAYGQAA